MKRYIKSSTENIYYYDNLPTEDSKEFAAEMFINYVNMKIGKRITMAAAGRILGESKTLFNVDGLIVHNNGNADRYGYNLPDGWENSITESDLFSKRPWFDNCLKNGIIYYDKHNGGYIYDYSEMGFTDEIFIGETEEEAFKTFCEINW